MNPKIDACIEKAKSWKNEISELRSILLNCNLVEELKWRAPCYTYQNKNIVLIGAFKDYCTLSFLKGVLLQDAKKILVAPGENSQSVRMIKFTDVKEIVEMEAVLKAYIFEAIEIEKSGLKVELKESSNLTFPEELLTKLKDIPELKTAFEALTPGRQRAYNMHFTSPKQSKTRIARIENCMPRIRMGKGLNDCICGHTKRPPNCDGSHKYI